jgi:oligoendopeptidase F
MVLSGTHDELLARSPKALSVADSAPARVSTCFASTAKLMVEIGGQNSAARTAAVTRYLDLLRAGGSDHPMALLKRAGVDLAQPDAVRAVVARLDDLVTRLNAELGAD